MRRSVCVFALALLAACGFSPMYGTSSEEATASRAAIAVEPIGERSGQSLRNILLDRGFGDVPVKDGMKLYVEPLVLTEFDLGLAPDNTATRRQLSVASGMTLKNGDTVLTTRKLTANSTYNVLVSQYGTIVSRQNAEKQVIEELARQIEMHTTLYLKDHSTP